MTPIKSKIRDTIKYCELSINIDENYDLGPCFDILREVLATSMEPVLTIQDVIEMEYDEIKYT